MQSKGKRVITEESKDKLQLSKEDTSTRTRKVFVKGETVNIIVPFTARMRVEVGDQVSRGAALTRGFYQPKRP